MLNSGPPAGRPSSLPPQAVDRLVTQLREVNPDPQDALDVAATLESFGLTDRQVSASYGYATIFDFAEDLLDRLQDSVLVETIRPPRRRPLIWQALHVLATFVHGLWFALPTAVSIAAMVTLRIAIWSYLGFGVTEATAIALGTFLSFVLTGGFIQAMSHSVYLFLGLGEPAMARSIAWRIFRWALMAAFLMALAALVADMVLTVLPLSVLLFMDLYFVLLSILWMALTGLYVLQKEYLLSGIIAIGVGIAYELWQRGLPVVLAQAVSLVTISALSLGLTWWLLQRLERRSEHKARTIQPRASQLAYATSPYFFYGVLYFAFIWVDRLNSWSTNNALMPFYIWFRGQYELGMDWSLLVLILPLGVIEVLIHQLMDWLTDAELRFPATRLGAIAAALRARYWRGLAIYGIAALVSTVLLRASIRAAVSIPALAPALPIEGIEPYVFNWATVGYLLLGASLYNVLVMFSLSYPAPALRAFVLGIAVDAGLGFVLTRTTGGYQMAVWGLVAGACLLLAFTTHRLLGLLREVDYLLYRMA